MSLHQEICRLCLQKADEYDVQNIDENVLPLIKIYFYIQNLPVNPLENHVICNTCITILKKVDLMSRQVKRFNTAIYLAQKRFKQTIINLRQLTRFKTLPDNVSVCRQCFEPTNKIALYLYDHEKNILPKEFIEVMFKYCKFYTRFDRTEKQIMCFKCWENLQACYNYQKYLNMAKSKISCYQNEKGTSNLSKEDLFKILEIWEELGKCEGNISDNIDLTLDLPEKAAPACRRNIMADIFKISHSEPREDIKELNNDKIGDVKPHIKEESINKKVVTNLKQNDEIPDLTGSKQDELCDKKEGQPRKNTKRKRVSSPKSKKKRINNISRIELAEEMPMLTSVVGDIEDKKVNNSEGCAGYRTRYSLANKSSKSKKPVKKKNTILDHREYVGCRTRSKLIKTFEDDTGDLLILQREEIIKRKPLRKTKAPTANKNIENQNGTLEILGSSFDHAEIVTLDMDIQVKKELIEQEEVEIKREILSDSEDYFSENGEHVGEILNFTENDRCPNLVSFIKTEPPDDTDMDEEPPELEFQGPCPSVITSTPNVNFQNTFKFDTTKFSMIRNVDDKRTVLNFVDESNSSEEQAKKKNDKMPKETPGAEIMIGQNLPMVNKYMCVAKDPTNSDKDAVKIPITTKGLVDEKKLDLQSKEGSGVAVSQNFPTTPTTGNLSIEEGSTSKQGKKIRIQSVKILNKNFKCLLKADEQSKKSEDIGNKTQGEIIGHSSKQPASEDRKYNLRNYATDSKKGIKSLEGHEYKTCFHCKQLLEEEPASFCTKCGKTYHANCLGLNTTFCRHSIVLKRDIKQVTLSIPFCGICSQSIARWITCQICWKSFHPNCIYGNSADTDTLDCLHNNKNKIFDSLLTVVESTVEGAVSAPYALFEAFEKRRCNVCKKPPLKWASCKVCSGHFHPQCLLLEKKSGIISVANNCHHLTKLLHSNISLSWKQVALYHSNESQEGETLNPKVVISRVCASCNTLVETWVWCKKCRLIFHPHCFMESRTARCDHMDEKNLGMFMIVRRGKVIELADLYTALKFEKGCDLCHVCIKQPLSIFCTKCQLLTHRGCHQKTLCKQHTDYMVTVLVSKGPVSLKKLPDLATPKKFEIVDKEISIKGGSMLKSNKTSCA